MLSEHQKVGLRLIGDWLKSRDPIFNLNGYAGTGKTHLAKSLREVTPRPIFYAAYTGKATVRLRQKGCEATTLHSLFYSPAGDSEEIVQLTKMLRHEADPVKKRDIKEKIEIVRAKGNKSKFKLKEEPPLPKDAILVIDEASMVSWAMLDDIRKQVSKIVLLGDPAQLPPVMGRSILDEIPCDYLLTEIHRQALDNPIIRAATLAREGREIPMGVEKTDSGWFRQVPAYDTQWEDYSNPDQILVGTNRTRRGFNRRYRERKGLTVPHPQPGERIIVLRNSYDVEPPLYNGTVIVVENCGAFAGELYIDGVDEITGEKRYGLPIWEGCFIGLEADGCPRDFIPADFANAMTVHKAQGSEWGNVVVYAEPFSGLTDQWLYTAITRSANTCTLVRP